MQQPTWWFVADLHFGHANVIRYSGRPYADLDDMHRQLVANWNAVVRPRDYVIILGDLAMVNRRNRDQMYALVAGLKGQKCLVYGNHDEYIEKHAEWQKLFLWCDKFRMLRLPDAEGNARGQQHIFVCHYAMRVWPELHYGTWQLYGHSHGKLTELPGYLAMDVGVDATQLYRPISYAEVKAHMAGKRTAVRAEATEGQSSQASPPERGTE
jgi:calcineurin-like phosphoesterase family protein